MVFENIHCGFVRRRLNAYIDGELTGRDREFVSRHLERCSECRGARDGLVMLEPLLREFDIPDVPERLVEGIMFEATERVRRGFPRVHAAPSARPGRFERAFSRAAVAAVLMIGLAAGSFLGWSAWRGEAAPSASDDPGSVNVEVVYSLNVFGTAPYGSIESAFTTAENGGKEM